MLDRINSMTKEEVLAELQKIRNDRNEWYKTHYTHRKDFQAAEKRGRDIEDVLKLNHTA